MVPKITREERKRDTMLDVEDAKEILDQLTTYQFAPRDHVLMALLWSRGFVSGRPTPLIFGTFTCRTGISTSFTDPDTGRP